MSSCAGGSFLNRKYSLGKFTQGVKTLPHHTFCLETAKTYASLDKPLNFKHSCGYSINGLDNGIMDVHISSIVRKDSIFIIQKKGKNKIIVVKNNLPDVTITVKGNQKIIKPVKVVDQAKIKLAKESKIKKFSKVCLYLSFVPFLGFVFILTTRRIIKKYNKEYPDDQINSNKARINLSLIISILSSIFGLIAIIYLFYLYFLANTMTAIY